MWSTPPDERPAIAMERDLQDAVSAGDVRMCEYFSAYSLNSIIVRSSLLQAEGVSWWGEINPAHLANF